MVSGDNWEFIVRGRIDGATANEMELEVLAAIKGGTKEIFLNFAEADWICSAGIRVILQYHRQMKNAGKKLLVTRPSEGIDAILDMTGFRGLIVEGASPQA